MPLQRKANPLVSVVLCTYNEAPYIAQAIDSVLAQTWNNIELIVVDNGSTDATADVVSGYASDRRVCYIRESTNGNITSRLNQGIAVSKGRYVSLLYGDDFYLPEKLAIQVAAFSSLPASYGVVYGPGVRWNILNGKRWIEPAKPVFGSVLNHMLRASNRLHVNPISPLIDRRCFEAYPFYDDLFVEGESINLRFAMTFKYHYLDEPLVVMREHDQNIGKALRYNCSTMMKILDRLAAHSNFPHDSRGPLSRYRASLLRDYAWQGVRVVDDVEWTRSCLTAARKEWRPVLYHPRTLASYLMATLSPSARRLGNGALDKLRRDSNNRLFKTDHEKKPA